MPPPDPACLAHWWHPRSGLRKLRACIFAAADRSPRRLRLAACALWRASPAWGVLVPAARESIALAERIADTGPAGPTYRSQLAGLALALSKQLRRAGLTDWEADEDLATSAWYVGASSDVELSLPSVWSNCVEYRTGGLGVPVADRKALLRCVFGDPHWAFVRGPADAAPLGAERVWVEPAVRDDPRVAALAAQIYADGSFGLLPVLADLLEEAGCNFPLLLAHLRGPGPHAKGCWPLSLILTKEAP
jgi:hypothetical protein